MSDSGPGVAADERDMIFERFQRGSTPPAARTGFGLGLAIGHELAQRLGGGLTLDAPTAPGRPVARAPRAVGGHRATGGAARADGHGWAAPGFLDGATTALKLVSLLLITVGVVGLNLASLGFVRSPSGPTFLTRTTRPNSRIQ